MLGDRLRLWLAKYRWLRGTPPRSGTFLLQCADGTVHFEWWLRDAPGNRKIEYWRRANAPLPPPVEYMSYNPAVREAEGVYVPRVHSYY